MARPILKFSGRDGPREKYGTIAGNNNKVFRPPTGKLNKTPTVF